MKLIRALKVELGSEVSDYISFKGGINHLKENLKQPIRDLRGLLARVDLPNFTVEEIPTLREDIYNTVNDMPDTLLAMLGFQRDNSLRQRLLRILKLKKYSAEQIKADALTAAAQEILRLKLEGGGGWYEAHERLRAKVDGVDKQMGLMSSQYESMQKMFVQVVEQNEHLKAENTELRQALGLLQADKEKDEATIARLQARVAELEGSEQPNRAGEVYSHPFDDLVHGSHVLGDSGNAAVAGH